MRYISFLFIAFLLLHPTTPAQEGWFWQNPLPQGNDLNDMWVFDENTAIAVGRYGTIIKTTNGGDDWFFKSSKTPMDLRSVYFIDDKVGWSVGYSVTNFGGCPPPEEGVVLYTTNGGEDWLIINEDYFFRSIYFVDNVNGWACHYGAPACPAGGVFKTTDGGLSWTYQFIAYSIDFNSVFFIDDKIGWAVGWSIYKTTNSGLTWTSQDHSGANIYDVYFIDSSTGWVVGADGGIFKTTDGGDNWISQTSGTTSHLSSIYFENENLGWVVGHNYGIDENTILKTTNGGANWFTQATNTTRGLSSVKLADENIGWIVGACGNILRTTNGGADWISRSSSITYSHLWSTHFIDDNKGWAVGGETIISTTNAGELWSTDTIATNEDLTATFFTNATTGWVVGYEGTIFNTTNSGKTWLSQSSGTLKNLYSVFFMDDNNGWIVGYSGMLLKTTNGGTNWVSQVVGDDSYLLEVQFNDVNNGWIVGGDATLLKTSNGGEDWMTLTSGFPEWETIHTVFFIDSNTGWIAGGDFNYPPHFPVGLIQKTTNGGAEFINQYQDSIYAIADLHFISSDIGWAIGISITYGSIILKTTNGGQDWTRLPIYNSESLRSIFFTNDSTGWVVGWYGAILHTKKLNVTDVKEEPYENPNTFCLMQNYPNPFNPSTKIRYSVPQSSEVVIKVFDILGKEIETLVNEEKTIGTYELNWFAENLPSGVYFFRLRAGNFIQTKKMVLVK